MTLACLETMSDRAVTDKMLTYDRNAGLQMVVRGRGVGGVTPPSAWRLPADHRHACLPPACTSLPTCRTACRVACLYRACCLRSPSVWRAPGADEPPLTVLPAMRSKQAARADIITRAFLCLRAWCAMTHASVASSRRSPAASLARGAWYANASSCYSGSRQRMTVIGRTRSVPADMAPPICLQQPRQQPNML